MKNNKKVFICLEGILFLFVIILGFIMYREQKGETRHKISVILPDSDASQWSAFRYGLKMAAQDCGVEMFVVSVSDNLTVHEEMKTIQYEIDNGADAVIVMPVPGMNTEAKLKKIEKKIPVMLVESTASKDSDASLLPTTEPDNYAMGKALAKELLADYNGNIKGKTMGIVMSSSDCAAVVNRARGFQEIIENTGVEVRWFVSGYYKKPGKNFLEYKSKVDLVIALDDISLTAAGECAAENNLRGALVYGIGNSTEAVNYLDTGIAECLIVPDDFNVGYQSLVEVAEDLKHFFHKMKNQTLSYTVLRREELFSEKNQEIIFTMSQ